MKANRTFIVAGFLVAALLAACERSRVVAADPAGKAPATKVITQSKTNMSEKVVKTEEEWKKTLSAEQYRVLRQKGTERAFTGEYWNHHEKGEYRCAGCGTVLFTSDSKFDSGCGWPSYSSPADKKAITEHDDLSYGMTRTEVLCTKCGGHLGHVFNDGPQPTGLRYCINSASIKFEKKDEPKKEPEKK